MRLLTWLALVPLSVLCSSQSVLYLSPPPLSPSSSSSSSATTLSAPQTNALLSAHLGVSEYESLPLEGGRAQSNWVQLLSAVKAQGKRKVILLVECPKGACQELVPSALSSQTPFTIPNLPSASYLSLLTLHAHRFANSLSLPPTATHGLEKMGDGIKQLAGWAGWVGEELGAYIGWTKFKAAVVDERKPGRVLADTELLLDQSAARLVRELEDMAAVTDRLSSEHNEVTTDSTAQRDQLELVSLHLSGLLDIAKAHGTSSNIYKTAAYLFNASLEALFSALDASHAAQDDTDDVALLLLPPYSPPLLRKRTPYLEVFSTGRRYSTQRRAVPAVHLSSLHKRQEGDLYSALAPKDTPRPIVPSSSTCFESSKDAKNQTDDCLGHGTVVEGQTNKGGSCWVCKCENGWGGEGCQKEDLSNDFTLLFFSGLGLLIVLYVSVMLLANIGGEELPSTLAAVSGASGSSHRRD